MTQNKLFAEWHNLWDALLFIVNEYCISFALKKQRESRNISNGSIPGLKNPTGNALERVQRVHEPADLWDITFCTR